MMTNREIRSLTQALAILNDATARMIARDLAAANLAAGMRRVIRKLLGAA